MRIVDQSVQDTVCDSRIADLFVPPGSGAQAFKMGMNAEGNDDRQLALT